MCVWGGKYLLWHFLINIHRVSSVTVTLKLNCRLHFYSKACIPFILTLLQLKAYAIEQDKLTSWDGTNKGFIWIVNNLFVTFIATALITLISILLTICTILIVFLAVLKNKFSKAKSVQKFKWCAITTILYINIETMLNLSWGIAEELCSLYPHFYTAKLTLAILVDGVVAAVIALLVLLTLCCYSTKEYSLLIVLHCVVYCYAYQTAMNIIPTFLLAFVFPLEVITIGSLTFGLLLIVATLTTYKMKHHKTINFEMSPMRSFGYCCLACWSKNCGLNQIWNIRKYTNCYISYIDVAIASLHLHITAGNTPWRENPRVSPNSVPHYHSIPTNQRTCYISYMCTIVSATSLLAYCSTFIVGLIASLL